MADVIDCDVVIQAGHENTPDGITGGEGPLGREIEWTPIVANEAVRVLTLAGVNAVKETAYIKVTAQRYRCRLALFIHFDAPDSGEAGPSVGYEHSSDAVGAEQWKNLYKEFFPFAETWQRDNVTDRERHYYGFKFIATSDAEFLIELGDLHSLRQAQWLKPRLVWLGQLVAYFVSNRIAKGGVPKPAAFTPIASPLVAALSANAIGPAPKPVGDPVPFFTDPSASGNAYGNSKTKGLRGTLQKFDDGSVVLDATEPLSASRTDGLDATLTAVCRRIQQGHVTTVEQRNYSYRGRVLPLSTLTESAAGIPADVPDNFQSTPVRAGRASQFGKNDHEDEGTGSPIMGLIQTNSEVFGASLKMSIMAQLFGDNWRNDIRRLGALIDVYFGDTKRMVRVPLVDLGPAESVKAEVDLTWACDQFLGTQGQADVVYRVLLPTNVAAMS
jgi:hypothetical protein